MIKYERALGAVEYALELLAKQGPRVMKKYRWARAFRALDRAKKKETKRLAKLNKKQKQKTNETTS